MRMRVVKYTFKIKEEDSSDAAVLVKEVKEKFVFLLILDGCVRDLL
jgi:hypothetical protein